MTTPAGDSDRLESLRRGWQLAEDRLYPLVMVRPDAYATAVSLVRAVADRLHDVQGDALAQAYDDAPALVAAVVRDSGLPSEGIDLGLVAGAAFNLRYREARASADREQAKERIRSAAADGADWVVLFEMGDPESAPLRPYRRLEMRLSDGRGLHASITTDPMTMRPVYAVDTVQLDPATGDWLHDAEAAEPPLVLANRGEWEAAVTRMREGDTPETVIRPG